MPAAEPLDQDETQSNRSQPQLPQPESTLLDVPVGVKLVGDFGEVAVPSRMAPERTPEAPTPPRSRSLQATTEEEAKLRLTAFRAVVKDDTTTLANELLSCVKVDVWREWVNRAGKDLLTLSEERGSVAAYSMLAKALGLLQERKRDAYEERETVWVMYAGEVQPLRATVLEDTPEEAEEILLEFWEGDEPAKMVHRDFVLKCS